METISGSWITKEEEAFLKYQIERLEDKIMKQKPIHQKKNKNGTF
ncbi:hypothetical protein [Flavobacterium ovatum]